MFKFIIYTNHLSSTETVEKINHVNTILIRYFVPPYIYFSESYRGRNNSRLKSLNFLLHYRYLFRPRCVNVELHYLPLKQGL